MAKKSSGGTPAISVLKRSGIAHTLHSYAHDPRTPSYGLEAAEALGFDPARVLKTLLIEVDGELCVGIVPVDSNLDLKAAAHVLEAKKAAMADPAAAQRATGYVVGGISPFGQKRPHRTIVDASALAWETVVVSAGRRGLDVEVAVADLVRVTSARLADIARR